jgi:hypothetical protein
VRTRAAEIAKVGRNTQGVTLIRLPQDEILVGVVAVDALVRVRATKVPATSPVVRTNLRRACTEPSKQQRLPRPRRGATRQGALPRAFRGAGQASAASTASADDTLNSPGASTISFFTTPSSA